MLSFSLLILICFGQVIKPLPGNTHLATSLVLAVNFLTIDLFDAPMIYPKGSFPLLQFNDENLLTDQLRLDSLISCDGTLQGFMDSYQDVIDWYFDVDTENIEEIRNIKRSMSYLPDILNHLKDPEAFEIIKIAYNNLYDSLWEYVLKNDDIVPLERYEIEFQVHPELITPVTYTLNFTTIDELYVVLYDLVLVDLPDEVDKRNIRNRFVKRNPSRQLFSIFQKLLKTELPKVATVALVASSVNIEPNRNGIQAIVSGGDPNGSISPRNLRASTFINSIGLSLQKGNLAISGPQVTGEQLDEALGSSIDWVKTRYDEHIGVIRNREGLVLDTANYFVSVYNEIQPKGKIAISDFTVKDLEQGQSFLHQLLETDQSIDDFNTEFSNLLGDYLNDKKKSVAQKRLLLKKLYNFQFRTEVIATYEAGKIGEIEFFSKLKNIKIPGYQKLLDQLDLQTKIDTTINTLATLIKLDTTDFTNANVVEKVVDQLSKSSKINKEAVNNLRILLEKLSYLSSSLDENEDWNEDNKQMLEIAISYTPPTECGDECKNFITIKTSDGVEAARKRPGRGTRPNKPKARKSMRNK